MTGDLDGENREKITAVPGPQNAAATAGRGDPNLSA